VLLVSQSEAHLIKGWVNVVRELDLGNGPVALCVTQARASLRKGGETLHSAQHVLGCSILLHQVIGTRDGSLAIWQRTGAH